MQELRIAKGVGSGIKNGDRGDGDHGENGDGDDGDGGEPSRHGRAGSSGASQDKEAALEKEAQALREELAAMKARAEVRVFVSMSFFSLDAQQAAV